MFLWFNITIAAFTSKLEGVDIRVRVRVKFRVRVRVRVKIMVRAKIRFRAWATPPRVYRKGALVDPLASD